MKIAVAGGHSKAAPGAHGHLDEYTEDRAVASALLAELQRHGIEVVSCTNEKTTQGSELTEEVRLANASGADLFVAIHFNAASPTDGTRGVETWFHNGSSASNHAVAVTNKLAAALSLPNRGAKSTTKLYVLKHTKMPAILVEVCFIDALGDANAYRKLGAQGVARAIADGILGTNTQATSAAKPAEHPAAKPAAKPSAKIDDWGSVDCKVSAIDKSLVIRQKMVFQAEIHLLVVPLVVGEHEEESLHYYKNALIHLGLIAVLLMGNLAIKLTTLFEHFRNQEVSQMMELLGKTLGVNC